MVLEENSSIRQVLDKNSSADLAKGLAKMKIGFNRLVHKRKKWLCSCGCKVRRDGKAEHLRSDKHRRLVDGKPFDKRAWAKKACECELCGLRSTRGNLATHRKSKRCLKGRVANKQKSKGVKREKNAVAN